MKNLAKCNKVGCDGALIWTEAESQYKCNKCNRTTKMLEIKPNKVGQCKNKNGIVLRCELCDRIYVWGNDGSYMICSACGNERKLPQEHSLKTLVLSLGRRIEKLEESQTELENTLLERQKESERIVTELKAKVLALLTEDI